MSAFEYVFTFYSVMLGLAATNVAAGFADMWRDRETVKVGVCAPLLALIVLVGTMNLWLRFWTNRDLVEASAWQLITLVTLALPFVFISRAMFPGPGGESSLEEHFFRHRRVMLLALTATPGFSLIWYARVGELDPDWSHAWIAVRFAAPLVLLAIPNRRINQFGLAAIAIWVVIGLFR